MREAVYEWMKNLAFFYIFLTMVMNVVPNQKYGELIRFFLGLLLISILLTPFLDLFSIKTSILQYYEENRKEEMALESQIRDWSQTMEKEADTKTPSEPVE